MFLVLIGLSPIYRSPTEEEHKEKHRNVVQAARCPSTYNATSRSSFVNLHADRKQKIQLCSIEHELQLLKTFPQGNVGLNKTVKNSLR